MSDAADAVDRPIVDLATRSGDSTAMIEALLSRIDRLQPELNAFVTVTHELARRQAGQVLEPRGALQGVPFGLKDVIDTRGTPTTLGAARYRDRVPDRDATVVERLRAAGAVLVGKLHTAELANAFATEWSFNGPCKNPWDPSRETGSSSSGPAVAVAAGLASFALATETLGSIDHPAAYCGVTGLRPTFGRVSRFGVMEAAPTMDKVGVIARRAADCRVVLSVIAGPDERDPATLHPPTITPSAHLRVGVLPLPSDLPERAVAAAFEQARQALADAGVTLVPVTLPTFPEAAVSEVIVVSEAFSVFEELIRTGDVQTLAGGRGWTDDLARMGITGADYVKAQRIRAQLQAAYGALFGTGIDAVLSHGRPNVAPPLGQPPPYDDGPTPFRRLLIAGNLAGMPALTLPGGFSASGLPVSVHLAARPWDEETLLTLGEIVQRVTHWHEQRPPAR